jgi:hypothetical protein
MQAIDAFVESLDLNGLGFKKAQAKSTGSPPFHPGDLLKMYIYGRYNMRRSMSIMGKKGFSSFFMAVANHGTGGKQRVSSDTMGNLSNGLLLKYIYECRWRCFCTLCRYQSLE